MPEIPTERMSIWVQIKLDGEYFGNDAEYELRYKLEDAVIELGIGEPEGAGSGAGWMDFSFSVADIDKVDGALLALGELLDKHKVPNTKYRFEVFPCMETICDEQPSYQPGDCLTFNFDDKDYGAVIVLKVKGDNKTQVGKQPLSSESSVLIGVLDYKHPELPPSDIFEKRNWLISTSEHRKGKPYLIWVSCYGGVQFEVVHQIHLLETDPMSCKFTLDWENVPEYFIREKYRDNLEMNPYEIQWDNLTEFLAGDCLSFPFPDGYFGAALVLATSRTGCNWLETLLGILDYKQPIPPTKPIFEQRKWLVTNSMWRKSQPYLVWALWEPDEIEINKIGHINLHPHDPLTCHLNLNWHDIPKFLLHENNFNQPK